MPTLPLHLPAHAVPPGASHRVTSPGGYEQWTIEATSDDGEVRLVATFYDGCPLDARYLDRYVRYRRRPTRVRPPVPSEYPAVYVTLFERGREVVKGEDKFVPGACDASTESLDVRIGPNRLWRDAQGNVRLVLTGAIGADLELRPAGKAAELDASGEIRLAARPTIRFAGRGTLEKRVDTAPPVATSTGASVRWMLWLLAAILLLVFAASILGASDLHDKSQPKTVAYTADVVLHGRLILPRDMVGGPARKPPLYNWVGAPFVAVLGFHEWVLKIPAMIAGVGAVAVSVVMARRLFAAPE